MRKGGRQSAQGLLVLQLLQCVCCNTWQKSGSIPDSFLRADTTRSLVRANCANPQRRCAENFFALLCAACKFFWVKVSSFNAFCRLFPKSIVALTLTRGSADLIFATQRSRRRVSHLRMLWPVKPHEPGHFHFLAT